MPVKRSPKPSLELPVTDDCAGLLTSGRAFLDVRAPVEFSKGSVPGAVNLPLLDDDERAAVGTRHRQGGRDAAIALGHELVAGQLKERRVAAWCKFVRARPDSVLYCARGGLRSEIAQRWLAEAGVPVARVAGGFKSLRNFCIQAIDDVALRAPLVVVGGRTGCGKTAALGHAARHIDLEGLANHRGSAFGGRSSPQPPPVTFENGIAVALLKLGVTGAKVAVEDESRQIGRLALPGSLYQAMQKAPIFLIEADLDARIGNIYREYVLDEANPAAHLTASLDRIRQRLGGERHREIAALMAAAFESGDEDRHRAWIGRLLTDYYDPMYDYQIAGKTDRVVGCGDSAAAAAYLAAL